MKHKVLGSVFVLAVALGMISVTLRKPMTTPPAVPVAKKAAEHLNAAKAAENPNQARALASYRVSESGVVDGMDYRGAGYTAHIGADNVRFGSKDQTLVFGTPRFAQGSKPIECSPASFTRPAFGVGRLERGPVTEEYITENNRMEQLFRIPAPVGEGAFRVTIPVAFDFPVTADVRPPHSDEFEEVPFRNGGIAFKNAEGKTVFAYHTAVAVDAADRKIALAPRHESNSIVLEVPADFMAKAAYPVVIDPWLDLAGSGGNGGISGNATTSQRPAIAITNGGLIFIAWSDDSNGNYEIYMKWWNGFEFKDLGGSSLPGGISNNVGKSVNPCICLDGSGSPTIAWEDDTAAAGTGAVQVFCAQWPHVGEGTSWLDLAGSKTSGIVGTFGPAQHPSVGVQTAFIPGVVSIDSNNNITSTPSETRIFPVVAYEDTQSAGSQIYIKAFYGGAPAQPPVQGVFPRGLPAVPGGWYQLGLPGGTGVDSKFNFPFSPISQTPLGFIAQFPSLVVDADNRVTVAWQDTRDGNYEIYCKRYTYNGGVTGFRPFEIRAIDPGGTAGFFFQVEPPGDFTAVAGPVNGRVTTSAANASQYPSLAFDPTFPPAGAVQSNLTLAWQETTGTTSQIFVLRSTNGGAFLGPLSGSATPDNVSVTLGHAVTPSCDTNGGYIGVAWMDDSNPNKTSIYVRRCNLASGVLWEQVGFQGSAFPAAFFGEFAPIDGISKTLNFSDHPSLKMDIFGSPTVAWSDGSAATFDVLLRTFSPNGPGIADVTNPLDPRFLVTLNQTVNDPQPLAITFPGTTVNAGDFTVGTTVWLSTRIFTETLLPAGSQIFVQFEVQPTGSAFTGTYTHQTVLLQPDAPAPALPLPVPNIAAFQFNGIPNANYHWQARTLDQIGRASPWIAGPTLNGVSFRVNAAAAGGGGTGSNGGTNTGTIASANTSSKGSCGLLGLEAVAALGLIRLLRRKRSK